jgi:hypothetical protein
MHIVNIMLSHLLYQNLITLIQLLAANSKHYNVLLHLQRKRHISKAMFRTETCDYSIPEWA